MNFKRRDGLLKLVRFVRLYGLRRTIFKVAGRERRFPVVWRSRSDADIAMVGCGQYAFSTIGYFISRKFGARFRWCYDPNKSASNGFARGFRVAHQACEPDEWLSDPQVRYVYIASNHASHTDYACAALASGRSVYVEKPVSVSYEQLVRLEIARRKAEVDGRQRLFAGYNRPFSAAIRAICAVSKPEPNQPLSLCCHVSGHMIDKSHWYRQPTEGTRICGNAGHWIDLFVHLSARRGREDDDGMANTYRISLLSASASNPDDDLALSISSDRGDIFTLMLTARAEPFEGINETINFQQGETIAKIDDFCRMMIWQGAKKKRYRFWPKDVGHGEAVLQPFKPSARRWQEVLDSTVLMLAAADMVRNGEVVRTVSLLAERSRIAEASRSTW
jgi:predicted dehydrogenase